MKVANKLQMPKIINMKHISNSVYIVVNMSMHICTISVYKFTSNHIFFMYILSIISYDAFVCIHLKGGLDGG